MCPGIAGLWTRLHLLYDKDLLLLFYSNQPLAHHADTSRAVYPISSLTPYQNRWTIRARVTSKSNIKTWSNSRGEGKLFNIELVDESVSLKMQYIGMQTTHSPERVQQD